MADHYKKPYLDASVFISWIKGETINNVDRCRIVTHILKKAESGDFHVYTSTLTLAEVHKVRGQNGLASNEDERLLDFFEHDFFRFIDLDRRIGEDANRLCRSHGLRPNDAIHVASALKAGCDVILAWDRDLLRVHHDALRIEEPQIIGQLDFGNDLTDKPNTPELG